VQHVRNMVRAMKAHPEFSSDILKVLFDGLQALLELAPGRQAFDLD
jgi:hypothetical protein